MSPKETLNNEKQLLRDLMKGLVPCRRMGNFEAYQSRLVTLGIWKKSKTILLYSALHGEPDPARLVVDFPGHVFVFPRIEGEYLGLYQHTDGSRWIPGPHGLKEPDPGTWKKLSVRDIDLALIPGLAFDALGGRLGRGAGFYDRLLGTPDFKGVKIGLCWDWQLIPWVPRDTHDIPMDLIISEENILEPRSTSLQGDGRS